MNAHPRVPCAPVLTLSRSSAPRPGGATVLVAALVSLLAGCSGGGGGSEPPPAPTVSSIVVGAPRYSQTLLITVNGTRLDLLPAVASAACTGMQRSTMAPNVSSATSAFYTCTVEATGAAVVSVTFNGTALGSQAYTVPEPQVTLTLTNGAGVAGDVVLTLDPTRVKATVDNFLRYTNDGYYSGTIFHRVIDDFVAQGGGYLPHATGVVPALKPGQRAPIALEVGRGLSNIALSVAMARSAAADSATSQFFINLVDNLDLDPGPATAGYAVFGQVSAGASVVAALAAAPCAALPPISECAPGPNVEITNAAQTR